MRPLIVIAALAAATALLAPGCSRKAKPSTIEALELRTDDVSKFAVKVPSNWQIQTVPGELIIAISNPAISRRFLSFAEGEGGAKVELRAIRMDSTTVLDSMIKNSKLEFEDGLDRYEISTATLGGKPATKLSVKFDQADGEYQSDSYFVENDSVITIFTLASFGGNFSDYASEFEEILASVKIAQRPVVAPVVDTLAPTGPEPPSDTLAPYSGQYFAIKIPQNFDGEKVANGLGSVNFIGSRLDCNIQVDVLDATKQKNLDKIVAENKATYKSEPKSVTLGGKPAKFFAYNPSATISSRAYFCVNGNKLFRITVNWYKPEEKIYLPIFEKSLATITFK